jgi:hypothetical protein
MMVHSRCPQFGVIGRATAYDPAFADSGRPERSARSIHSAIAASGFAGGSA